MTHYQSAATKNATKREMNPAAHAYWASVTRCTTRQNGETGIVHNDGSVERFASDGRLLEMREGGAKRVESILRHSEALECHAKAA